METKQFWWMKSPANAPDDRPDTSSSLAEFKKLESSITELFEEQQKAEEADNEPDIASILEEINRVAAQSPLGPFEKPPEERSVEEIMREAERIFVESSKSFEQLSGRSKATSRNITEIDSKDSTPTPKSVSPLPEDEPQKAKSSSNSESESYSDDFSAAEDDNGKESVVLKVANEKREENAGETFIVEEKEEGEVFKDETAVRLLEMENDQLRRDVAIMQHQLKETQNLLDQTKRALTTKTVHSPEINLELERALEEVKDTKERNTALELQLETLNKTHQVLKNAYEELCGSNKILERRVAELDNALGKYKVELSNVQKQKEMLEESERNLTRLLENEKMQVKSLKQQTEKDAKCILDLNRQIREMERIMSRKHPDSVSALIVAAKDDVAADSTRKILEDRIKTLEKEAVTRDMQSSKIFLEVQEKFNQMKMKYESHIEDLELHVADLKGQLKKKGDVYDVYTQTNFFDEQKIPQKETTTKATQTVNKPPQKRAEHSTREETHLLATIRGLQADLVNKERTLMRANKEVEDLRTTNKRLQKEREGSLRNLSERKGEFRSYPEKLTDFSRDKLEEELRAVKTERDKMKGQLCRIEGDYQGLKAKRLQDLTALQEAHEREVATYLTNIAPLREQLEVQQVSLTNLQSQLSSTKEQLAIVTVERDHLNNRLNSLDNLKGFEVPVNDNEVDDTRAAHLQRKIFHLEKRYEEREHRLRAIVQGLAQRNVTNRSCEQCAARQQQLIGYKTELDQLLATLRTLQ